MGRLVGLLVLAVALVGCGGTSAGPVDVVGSDDVRSVVERFEDVGYYPACGNEVLELDGRSWYPLFDQDSVDEDAYAPAGDAPDESALGGASLVAASVTLAVVEPGPGDDVGTLTIYDDGLARFVSDSGDIDVWVSQEPVEYGFVC